MDSLKTTNKEIIVLIVETGNASLWGRIHYDDNLIVDEGGSIEELQSKMRTLLLDFHDLDPNSYDFRIEYDLTAFFEKFDFLKITKVAELSGINGSLLRQYASGKKYPSAKQAAKIESAIKELANQLAEAHIYAH